ncbi:lactonase family protein [Spongiivirga sp. MCCC 1A20706]|uniref:lactonase family protein n=1 Tax=Spongiivirga sp. MCCC 1A20706 TaxID=3160963 RepID=UPI00397771E1
MKLKITILVLCLITACNNANKKEEKIMIAPKAGDSFFLGTYTDTYSEGIYRFTLNEDGTFENNGLVAKSNNPSFLAYSDNRNYVVAVNEISDENKMGTIESYSVLNDSLQFINRSSTGGAHPCFVTVNETGTILAANYTGGNLGLLNIASDGKLSELKYVKQYEGKSVTDRQEAPHAHSAWFDPNSDNIITVDLGTDNLWFASLNEKNEIISTEPEKNSLPPGSGPRHIAFHPTKAWFYVINELNNTVSLFVKSNSGGYVAASTISTLPADFEGDSFCADIHISSDGKFVYASNRGHNSLAIFSVNESNGELKLVGHESVKGDWPRNFSLSPDENYLVVANQKSQNLVSFKRDKNSGLLTYTDQIKAPSPVCVLF